MFIADSSLIVEEKLDGTNVGTAAYSANFASFREKCRPPNQRNAPVHFFLNKNLLPLRRLSSVTELDFIHEKQRRIRTNQAGTPNHSANHPHDRLDFHFTV